MSMNKIYETISCCRICNSTNILEVLNLGDQPPANSLYKSNDEKPSAVPLRLFFCCDCSTVQLGESINPEYLFNEYVWVTGTSKTANDYSRLFCNRALERTNLPNPKVAEIASNDGTFLMPFVEAKCNVIGIDPAKNIAEIATKNGIQTHCEFFSDEVANSITSLEGKKDI